MLKTVNVRKMTGCEDNEGEKDRTCIDSEYETKDRNGKENKSDSET
jgi:hypothetical protein